MLTLAQCTPYVMLITCKHLCVFPLLSVNVFIALLNCGGKAEVVR